MKISNPPIINTTNQFTSCYVSSTIVSRPYIESKDHLQFESELWVNPVGSALSQLARRVLSALVQVSIDKPDIACVRVQTSKVMVANICGTNLVELEQALNELAQFRVLMIKPNILRQSPWIIALVCLARLSRYQHG